jgi:hypothetical protein
MALAVIDTYIKSGRRALVLAHRTNNLRDQFSDRLDEPHWRHLKPRTTIEIPQRWRHISGNYDLLIVDEAHDAGYGVPGGDIQKIQQKIGQCPVLLLTGSPAFLIGRDPYPLSVGNGLHAFSVEEMQQAEKDEGIIRAAMLTTELAVSAYGVRDSDYTASDDVKPSVYQKFTAKATTQTLDDLLTAIGKRLKDPQAKWPRKFAKLDGASWNDTLVALQKTIIACDSIKMANRAFRYFRRKGVNCLVSHSQNNDISDSLHSRNIKRFKTDRSVSLLIVANRAQLGFDFKELVNFIDLTCTKSPNRIFQMMCRVIRTPETGKMQKLFVKVLPKDYDKEQFAQFMTGVLKLSTRELFTTWNGSQSAFRRTKIPVGPGNGGCGGDGDDDGSTGPEGNVGDGGKGGAGNVDVDVGGGGVGGDGDVGRKNKKKPAPRSFPMDMLHHGDVFQHFSEVNGDTERFAQTRLGDVLGVRVNDSEGTKRKILAAILAGEFSGKHPLYPRLPGYMSPSKASFDPQFRQACSDAGWIPTKGNAEGNKASILQAIKAGAFGSQHPLYPRLPDYTSPRKNCFDPQFRQACSDAGWLFRVDRRRRSAR